MREEINDLNKKLKLTQDSLNSAVGDFKKAFEDQVLLSQKLKKANNDLKKQKERTDDDNKKLAVMQNKLKVFNKG